jgi:quercetin dioxygenase-like cupin family protein
MERRESRLSVVWFAGTRVVVHVRASQSDGRLGVWESEEPRGVPLPLHFHTREDEQLVLLEGQVAVQVGDRVHPLVAGDTLALPRHVPHAHSITSQTARILTVATPGGFEGLFTELGVLAAPGISAPPLDIPALTEAVARLGVNIVGPPPPLDEAT